MKNNKRICIVIPTLKHWWWAENVSSKIWSELFNLWYNTKYFTFYNAETKYDYFGEEYCLNEKTKWNILFKIFKLFIRAYKIKKFCKKEKIDTIFSFMEDANFPVIISKFLWNKTKVNISIRHSISDYWKWIYYWLIKILYKYSNNIVVLTKFEKDNLIKTFKINEKMIKIIPNALDINKIEKIKNQDLWEYKKLFKDKKFTFITVWRLHKIKNQELIIKCFNKLKENNNDIQLIILWDWELKWYLKSLICQDVYFLWNQSNPHKFLLKSDCFLLSSYNEAFPNTIIEAMACWLPIIATDTQWTREILGMWEYWIITKNDNFDEFYNSMKNILLNKNLNKEYCEKSKNRINNYLINNIIKIRESLI